MTKTPCTRKKYKTKQTATNCSYYAQGKGKKHAVTQGAEYCGRCKAWHMKQTR